MVINDDCAITPTEGKIFSLECRRHEFDENDARQPIVIAKLDLVCYHRSRFACRGTRVLISGGPEPIVLEQFRAEDLDQRKEKTRDPRLDIRRSYTLYHSRLHSSKSHFQAIDCILSWRRVILPLPLRLVIDQRSG